MEVADEEVGEVIRAEVVKFGCGGRTRTSDHRINNPALYQLSYTTVFDAIGGRGGMVDDVCAGVNRAGRSNI